ncbi:deoxyribose-phosphate aldolase [candidate division TA06 bacterium]|uniref:Deoxyribose-phosphate aldolase n=1 Tax=candidate division TA06 bacterium TaxID=2250710 RepID=A0A933ICN2_UNCT6|nr:deoxyribose-phosphate aldolase [candidate division TA06 bacterium]
MAGFIDHTILKPEAQSADIKKLCAEARQHGFYSVCINPGWVPLAAQLLKGSNVKVCTVCGFPLGANAPEIKSQEARLAVEQGASEADMVINIGALKSGDHKTVHRDIAAVVKASSGALVKVVIETCLLTEEEKILACLISRSAGAHFVKTSTGFSTGGAAAADIALMRRTVGPQMGIKASGGVRSLEEANKMILAGASRIGTSSGVKIMEQMDK